ncbi:secretory pathway Sec39 [Aspergillus taichungensis]|uniref:Secretory pathway Sec39 n=1 Tax=Aspergillus taichungensis TaxID=482145 RepID=A0A2J5HTX8_9EURO|nr:secretory pathway Sec39 [Aspergillus taichungensis]
MAPLAGLSGAQVILLATHLCVTGDVSRLPHLQAQFPLWLPLDRLLRILLTFLPESTDPHTYTPVLEQLVSGSSVEASDGEWDLSPVQGLSEDAARKRVRKLRLLPLRHPDDDDTQDSNDLLTLFLIHRAHRIDAETALQPLILDLLLPFYQRSPTIRTWLISTLLPLLRLNYEYYPSQDETFSLDMLESMDHDTAINVFLSMTGSEKGNMDLVRNLRGVVGAWMYGHSRPKRRRLNPATRRNSISLAQSDAPPVSGDRAGWSYVNEWLLSRSLVDQDSVVSAFVNWDGPEDVDLGGYDDETEERPAEKMRELRTRYGQSGLAVVYANANTSEPSLEGSIRIVSRIAQLLDLESSCFVNPDRQTLPSVVLELDKISSATRVSLLQNALLRESNPLTHPSSSSISFVSALLLSMRILQSFGHPIPCRAAANMCLHSTEDAQLLEFKGVIASIVKQTKVSRDWQEMRDQLLWLRDWGADKQTGGCGEFHGLYWRLPQEVVDAEILKALLEVREYNLATAIYVQSQSSLTPAQVEDAIKEAIFAAYDNASNGNRTRGGMKKAYDILQAFQPHFPESVSFKQIRSLISATHALSFYSLTLQHGVPFQPVSIRVHADPISLIEKVLDQNAKAYTQVDDLLAIGRDLVAAGFAPQESDPSDDDTDEPTPREDKVVTAERRIMSLAISSALSSDDFGTAYSYILTRLTPPTLISSASALTNPAIKDDISWRAVYNAGRYRSPTLTSQTSLQTQITQLSQRMELLSLALILVPTPDPLPEILGAWRRCDEEMNGLRTLEAEEEHAWDARADASLPSTTLPGGFGPTDTEQDAFDTKQQHARRASRAHHNRLRHAEDAPMGLFEVARGAAMALHKNAFPLRGDGTPQHQQQQSSSTHARAPSDDDDSDERVRKRDMVSNMVTGGLASGIGWVLGAQPVNR